jgi:hypothetical protein
LTKPVRHVNLASHGWRWLIAGTRKLRHNLSGRITGSAFLNSLRPTVMRTNLFSRKRATIGIVVIAIMGACALAFVLYSETRLRINLDTFDQLSLGLEKSEVEAILGCPAGDYSNGTLAPLRNRQLYRKVDWDGKNNYSRRASEDWCGNEATIRVWFNADARVAMMEILSRREPDCSTWDRIRCFFRLW